MSVSEIEWVINGVSYTICMMSIYSEIQQGGSTVCLFLATARDRKRVYTHENTNKYIIGMHVEISANLEDHCSFTHRLKI